MKTTIVLAGLFAMCVAVPTQVRAAGEQVATHEVDTGARLPNADDMARWAKTLDDPARDAWQMPARVVEALQILPGQTVADVGAGSGYFTFALAKAPAAPRVYAVDVDPAMVARVRQRAAQDGVLNVSAIQASLTRANLPFPVDLVLLVETYPFLSDRVAYVTALRLRMKQTARLAIINARAGAAPGPPEEARFTPEQIAGEMAKAGFVLETQHDFLPRQHFMIFRLNP